MSDFDKLRYEWYTKIKEDGFNDIEPFLNYNNNIYDSRISSKHRRTKLTEAMDYSRMASFFLHDYRFESDFDYLVWQMHTLGSSYRAIAKNLNTSLRQVFNAMRRNKSTFSKYLIDFKEEDEYTTDIGEISMSNTGHKNISFISKSKLYQVCFRLCGENIYNEAFKTLDEAIKARDAYIANPTHQRICSKTDGRKNERQFPSDMKSFRERFVHSDYLLEHKSATRFDVGDLFAYNFEPSFQQLVWMITKDAEATCLYYWRLLKPQHLRQLQDRVEAGKLDKQWLDYILNKLKWST